MLMPYTFKKNLGLLTFSVAILVSSALAQKNDDLVKMKQNREHAAEAGKASSVSGPKIKVHVFYRESFIFGEDGIERSEDVFFDSNQSGEKDLSFPNMHFRAYYSNSPYEGRSLSISVSEMGNGGSGMSQLFQMDRRHLPQNEFQGSHGFSGLVYVNHSNEKSQLQYIVSVE